VQEVRLCNAQGVGLCNEQGLGSRNAQGVGVCKANGKVSAYWKASQRFVHSFIHSLITFIDATRSIYCRHSCDLFIIIN